MSQQRERQWKEWIVGLVGPSGLEEFCGKFSGAWLNFISIDIHMYKIGNKSEIFSVYVLCHFHWINAMMTDDQP